MESGERWRASGWFDIIIFSLFVTSAITMLIHTNVNINIKLEYILVPFCLISFIAIIRSFILQKNIRSAFSKDSKKYAGLPKAFRNNREFQRYILFRNELIKSQFKSADVKYVRSLFDVEQYTLGSYVAQRPITTWLAATLTVILGNSAKNWPLWVVGAVFGISVFIIFIFYQVPSFITAYRRRYELHRWLAWYEADYSEPTSLTVEHVNQPAG